MKKELAIKREKILKRISLEEYRGLLGFVERVYLSEYSLKVLLARKCSNLFFALIDLVREEDGGRVRRLYQQKFPEGKEPIVVSDRALCFFMEAIRSGEIKSILIVDDVMIHGTTAQQLFEQIKGLVEERECRIDVWSYAANRDEVLQDVIGKAQVDRLCGTHEWRVITDEIVDIFYLTGHAYTSYVPNVVLKGDSSLRSVMDKFRNDPAVKKIQNSFQEGAGALLYAWIDTKSWKFSLFRSVRFYRNEALEQCVVVPMVSLMPVREEVLLRYAGILEEFICPDYFNKVFQICRELSYRAIIYVVSSLWGRIFFEKRGGCSLGIEELENPREEEVNFGQRILNRERINKLKAEQIEAVMSELEAAYQPVDLDTLWGLSPDFQILNENMQHIPKQEESEKNPRQILNFLHSNAEKEEELWEENRHGGTEKRVRLDGYPLCCIPGFFKNQSKEDILMQVLCAIDLGHGSIITKAYKTENDTYYVSLLHSGERNYKYVEMRYFPFLYGLFEIEKNMRKEQGKYKHMFMEEYIKKSGENCTEYVRKDLNKLCGINVTEAYKSVLIRDSWNYFDQDALRSAIDMADEVLQNKKMGNEVINGQTGDKGPGSGIV